MVNTVTRIGNTVIEKKHRTYEVERIVKVRTSTDGKKEYNIKWKDYPDLYNEWKPESELNMETRIRAHYVPRLVKRLRI